VGRAKNMKIDLALVPRELMLDAHVKMKICGNPSSNGEIMAAVCVSVLDMRLSAHISKHTPPKGTSDLRR